MKTLVHRRFEPDLLAHLVADAPDASATLNDDQRQSLETRLRALATSTHRRLDAWTVEQGGRSRVGFRWSPATARRALGNAALRRATLQHASILDACRDEVADQLLRSVSGYSRSGSMAHWLASVPGPVVGLVIAEAVNWATQLGESAYRLSSPWTVAASDAYYDVAGARTTLRARRDLIVDHATGPIIVRTRSGAPGKSAGPGLRVDLTIETLANLGVAPSRIIGLWPDAGVALCVDGTMDDLRAGARNLVRTAIAQCRIVSPFAA